MTQKTCCQPRYFPRAGDEDTFVHDARKLGRYYLVGAGHCGTGVFSNSKDADEQIDGFSGYVRLSAKRWTGASGVVELWASLCDQLHSDGCHNNSRLPIGWTAPTPVARGCPAPPPTPAFVPPPAPTPAFVPPPAPAPATAHAPRTPATPTPLPRPNFFSRAPSHCTEPKRRGGVDIGGVVNVKRVIVFTSTWVHVIKAPG
ncbi:hypothetical protein C8R46DRAFT_1208057 [Mycena filopes]|nr:hypothetical protein C8R46DRAFT_1208057 [Mycena filopes]